MILELLLGKKKKKEGIRISRETNREMSVSDQVWLTK